MNKIYKCRKCGHEFEDESSDKFIKTALKKCPVCGSNEVFLIEAFSRKFAKKTIK